MDSFDLMIEKAVSLSKEMRAAGLSQEWDLLRQLDHKRQATLRLLRYENYCDLVSVEQFAESIERLLNINNEIVELVDTQKEEVAEDLERFRQSRRAAKAYKGI